MEQEEKLNGLLEIGKENYQPVKTSTFQKHKASRATGFETKYNGQMVEWKDKLDRDVQGRFKKIFQFYCQQNPFPLHSPTFQQIAHNHSVMYLNKWLLFCKDFRIMQKVSSQILYEIFRRNCPHNQMNQEMFIRCVFIASSQFSSSLREITIYLHVSSGDLWKLRSKQLNFPCFDTPVEPEGPRTKQSNRTANKQMRVQSKGLKQRFGSQINRKPTLNFQELFSMKIPVLLPVSIEEDDDIYLQQFKLTPKKQCDRLRIRTNVRNSHTQSRGNLTNSRSQKSNIFRKVNETETSGIIRRLDDKLSKYLRKI